MHRLHILQQQYDKNSTKIEYGPYQCFNAIFNTLIVFKIYSYLLYIQYLTAGIADYIGITITHVGKYIVWHFFVRSYYVAGWLDIA